MATSLTAAAVKPAGARIFKDIRRSMPTAAWFLCCACIAVVFLYPLFVMLAQSLKTGEEAARVPPTLFPESISTQTYTNLGKNEFGISILQALGNSAIVSISTTVLTVALATLAGYGFAKLRFRGSNLVFFVMLVAFMVPFQTIITPLYLVLRDMGLQGSLFGLILVLTTFNLPFAIFLMRNSFASLPDSLEEAAMIDGCGTLRAMWKVLMPLAIPGAVSAGLLTFFTAWNEFFATLALVTKQQSYTLPITLSMLATGQNSSINWGALQAGVALTIIPCLVLYLLLQKYYVNGLLSGAVK